MRLLHRLFSKPELIALSLILSGAPAVAKQSPPDCGAIDLGVPSFDATKTVRITLEAMSPKAETPMAVYPEILDDLVHGKPPYLMCVSNDQALTAKVLNLLRSVKYRKSLGQPDLRYRLTLSVGDAPSMKLYFNPRGELVVHGTNYETCGRAEWVRTLWDLFVSNPQYRPE